MQDMEGRNLKLVFEQVEQPDGVDIVEGAAYIEDPKQRAMPFFKHKGWNAFLEFILIHWKYYKENGPTELPESVKELLSELGEKAKKDEEEKEAIREQNKIEINLSWTQTQQVMYLLSAVDTLARFGPGKTEGKTEAAQGLVTMSWDAKGITVTLPR